MKIRSITNFFDPTTLPMEQTMDLLGQFSKEAVDSFAAVGIEVQSLRLATSPYPFWAPNLTGDAMAELANDLEGRSAQHGFMYISLGTALPEYPTSYAVIPAVLASTQNVFLTGSMTNSERGVSLPAVRACGEIITTVSTITTDGFTNLRFAALGNVPAGSPFLPSAYASLGKVPGVAIAVECADIVQEVFSRSQSLMQARNKLLEKLGAISDQLVRALEAPCRKFRVEFTGIDFSPAPHPSPACSSGAALEALGLSHLGLSGTLAAAAFLADTLDRGTWPRAGFNGLMLPVLEDSTLAARAAEGILTVKDLLMVSAVCGTGLDTIPLPGNATPDQITAVLLDVAVLSLRLAKPLTARLMPIPGKKAGDPTNFDFEFFANSKVMALDAEPLSGFFNTEEWIDFHPRSYYFNV